MKASTVAKKLLKFYGDDASKWTQGVAFRDEKGDPCLLETAVSYCLVGAGSKLGLSYDQRLPLYGCFNEGAAGFNDKPGRTFAQIKRRLKQIAAGDK